MRFFWVWLSFFLKKIDSQNWIFFFSNVTQKKNWTFFFQRYSKNWILLTTTRRIEPFFLISLWELNFFFNTTQKLTQKKMTADFVSQIRLKKIVFLNMTQRIELFPYDPKHSTFVFQNDSKNWTFFRYDPKKLNFFFFAYESKNWTSLHDSRNWIFFSMTRRIEPFFFKKKKHDSLNWTFFLITTHRN